MTGFRGAILNYLNEKYEETRACVLKPSFKQERPDGFALVVRGGLLAWTNVIAEGTRLRSQATIETIKKPAEWANEVETVVANIILNRMEAYDARQ